MWYSSYVGMSAGKPTCSTFCRSSPGLLTPRRRREARRRSSIAWHASRTRCALRSRYVKPSVHDGQSAASPLQAENSGRPRAHGVPNCDAIDDRGLPVLSAFPQIKSSIFAWSASPLILLFDSGPDYPASKLACFGMPPIAEMTRASDRECRLRARSLKMYISSALSPSLRPPN